MYSSDLGKLRVQIKKNQCSIILKTNAENSKAASPINYNKCYSFMIFLITTFLLTNIWSYFSFVTLFKEFMPAGTHNFYDLLCPLD